MIMVGKSKKKLTEHMSLREILDKIKICKIEYELINGKIKKKSL